jgi:hypothetical protein
MIVDPGIAGAVPGSRLGVLAIGVLILAQGVRVVRARRRTTFREAETPDPESAMELPTPGDSFDEHLLTLRTASRGGVRQRARNRTYDRLEAAAIETIARRKQCSREEAVRFLEDGSWTDDEYAAALFGGESDFDSLSLTAWLGSLVSLEGRFHRQARHAAYAILRLAEGEDE